MERDTRLSALANGFGSSGNHSPKIGKYTAKGPAKTRGRGCCRLFLCNLFRFLGGFSFCLFRRIGFFAVVVVAEVFDV